MVFRALDSLLRLNNTSRSLLVTFRVPAYTNRSYHSLDLGSVDSKNIIILSADSENWLG